MSPGLRTTIAVGFIVATAAILALTLKEFIVNRKTGRYKADAYEDDVVPGESQSDGSDTKLMDVREDNEEEDDDDDDDDEWDDDDDDEWDDDDDDEWDEDEDDDELDEEDDEDDDDGDEEGDNEDDDDGDIENS